MTKKDAIFPPGSTIGIIGGGQLGRMTALAAARLGYRSHVFCPDTDSPAAQVCDGATVAAYDDKAAIDRFARAVDVVTYEFENIPHDTVRRLADQVVTRPDWNALHLAQDRLREKDFLNDNGIPTTAYRPVGTLDALTDALADLGRPAILKTAQFGYDGKGQQKIGADDDPAAAWNALGSNHGILEAMVDFALEVSVVVARSIDGQVACFDVVENRHVNHILDETHAPAAISGVLADSALDMAARSAEALDLVGLLAVEMFVTRDDRILVNELAPRPHNSGHWTIDGCAVSQFEQFVRAVCGLPLGSTERHSDAVMKNLLGDQVENWPALLKEDGAILHLYGKSDARPGRKMGHVTRLRPRDR